VGKTEADRAKAQLHARLEVTRRAWAEADRVIAAELATVAVTCREGCAHCCRQEITLARAEAETAVDWIKASWDAERIAAFGDALKAWLAWYRAEYPKLLAAGVPRHKVIPEHGPQCPALVDNRCSIYPVRPLTCRTMYVTSSPDACRQESDPLFDRTATFVPVHALVRVVQPAYISIRAVVEKQGADYLASAHLLPEWLAHLLRVEDQPWRTTPALFG
jgi:Fe-S-cluster containining protein